MRRSRHIIAIVVLASALAADGTFVATPAIEVPAAAGTLGGTFAGRLVQRISAGLRRTVRTAYWQSNDSTRASGEVALLPVDAMISPALMTPSQFRLPPPAV